MTASQGQLWRKEASRLKLSEQLEMADGEEQPWPTSFVQVSCKGQEQQQEHHYLGSWKQKRRKTIGSDWNKMMGNVGIGSGGRHHSLITVEGTPALPLNLLKSRQG
jgi:hypothetical protein